MFLRVENTSTKIVYLLYYAFHLENVLSFEYANSM